MPSLDLFPFIKSQGFVIRCLPQPLSSEKSLMVVITYHLLALSYKKSKGVITAWPPLAQLMQDLPDDIELSLNEGGYQWGEVAFFTTRVFQETQTFRDFL